MPEVDTRRGCAWSDPRAVTKILHDVATRRGLYDSARIRASEQSDDMNSITVSLQLAGAVALLLFSLTLVRDGMVEAFGLRLKMILGFGTRTGRRAVLSGLIATLGLQSSTATALLTASFVDRDMVAPRRAQLVLLGANVGTALTAVFVSSGMDMLAPVLILAGYVARNRKGAIWRGSGSALIGVGLMLVSLMLLEQGTLPMRDSVQLAAFLRLLDGVWPIALIFSAGIAVLCSSSLAAVLLIASLDLPADLTVVMILGANLGGAVAPVLASAGLSVAARRVTISNLVVRAVGCLIALPFVDLAVAGMAMAPFHMANQAVEVHLVFNLALACLILPFNGIVHGVVRRLIPGQQSQITGTSHWLDETALETPLVALSGASREALAISDVVERMLSQARLAFRKNDADLLAEVATLEDEVDARQQEVKTYLSRLTGDITTRERRRSIDILDYVINLEHIGDIIDKGLSPGITRRISLSLRFSNEGYQELDTLFMLTQDNLKLAQTVFMTRDHEMARKLMEQKVEIRNLERQSAQRHLSRLRDGPNESRETSSLHLDLLRDLKRINAHAVAVAHPILDEEGLLIESRLRSV